MSLDKPSRITKYIDRSQEEVPDAKQVAVSAAIHTGLNAFDRHRKDLLAYLQELYTGSPKSKPFDEQELWDRLRFCAIKYFRNEAEVKYRVTTSATESAKERLERLEELENVFGSARRLADKAMQDDIGGWLFWAWYPASDLYNDLVPEGPLKSAEIEFNRILEGLAALETAAACAAKQLRKGRGRPEGTGYLPHDFFVDLESVYRDITGKTGRTGEGPFSQFVQRILIALGRTLDIQSVADAIKYTRKREMKDLATSRWGRSRSFLEASGKNFPVSQ
jgi:hypothetical protein